MGGKREADVGQRKEQSLQAKENLRLAGNQLTAGITTHAKHRELIAAVKKAESLELQAHLGYELALADLDRIVGANITFSSPPCRLRASPSTMNIGTP